MDNHRSGEDYRRTRVQRVENLAVKETTHSAGVAVVRHVDGQWRYLLLRVFDYWDFPKGEVEAGEEPLEAACREVREETTLEGLNFRWGYEFVESGPYGPRHKIARYYLAESPQGAVHLPINEQLGHPEHEEYRWVDVSEAAHLLNRRMQGVLAWVVSRTESRGAVTTPRPMP